MVSDTISQNPESYSNLLDLCIDEIPQISIRAARVAQICAGRSPEIITSIDEKKIIASLGTLKLAGVLRSFYKIFIDNAIPKDENLRLILIENSFKYLSDNNQAVAVRAYAMTVLEKIADDDLWLIPELLSAIGVQLDSEQSPGFTERATQIIKNLTKKIDALSK